MSRQVDNSGATPVSSEGVVIEAKPGTPVSAANPLQVSDGQSAPFSGAVAMVVGNNYTAQRSIGAYCSIAGDVTLVLADSSTITVPLSPGWQTFPFAVTRVSVSTATAVYYNLK